MPKNKLRVLSAVEAANALSMKEAILLMHEAFSQLSSGKIEVPQRVGIDISGSNGSVLFMPAYSPECGMIGIKTVSVFHDNPAKSLPTIHALILLMDAKTGVPRAIVDGEHLTALRTGAAAGLATDLLASSDARVAALFGTGVQGKTQLEAISSVRAIDKCLLFEKDRKKAEQFQREMSAKLGVKLVITDALEDLLEAEIICTATNSCDPVFDDRWVKNGAHINAIGAYRPDMSEVPQETVVRSKLIVDQRAACLTEAGDIVKPINDGLITKNHIHAELGEIVGGQRKGRVDDSEITLFKSVGNAIQDLVCANQILKNADAINMGTILEL